MANNRLVLVCLRCAPPMTVRSWQYGQDCILPIAKYYPSLGWASGPKCDERLNAFFEAHSHECAEYLFHLGYESNWQEPSEPNSADFKSRVDLQIESKQLDLPFLETDAILPPAG